MILVGVFGGLLISKQLRAAMGGKVENFEDHHDQKCTDQHSCGAIDPVSDPAYNMQQVIQNSILLEDHMSDKRKYCKDCICKHMQAMIAYCNEALTLAGNNIDSYPYIKECSPFYEDI
ncbi:hypothetical protein EBT25_16910, partial [bacterium]|nr:hypothetical protein [bacterium]